MSVEPFIKVYASAKIDDELRSKTKASVTREKKFKGAVKSSMSLNAFPKVVEALNSVPVFEVFFNMNPTTFGLTLSYSEATELKVGKNKTIKRMTWAAKKEALLASKEKNGPNPLEPLLYALNETIDPKDPEFVPFYCRNLRSVMAFYRAKMAAIEHGLTSMFDCLTATDEVLMTGFKSFKFSKDRKTRTLYKTKSVIVGSTTVNSNVAVEVQEAELRILETVCPFFFSMSQTTIFKYLFSEEVGTKFNLLMDKVVCDYYAVPNTHQTEIKFLRNRFKEVINRTLADRSGFTLNDYVDYYDKAEASAPVEAKKAVVRQPVQVVEAPKITEEVKLFVALTKGIDMIIFHDQPFIYEIQKVFFRLAGNGVVTVDNLIQGNTPGIMGVDGLNFMFIDPNGTRFNSKVAYMRGVKLDVTQFHTKGDTEEAVAEMITTLNNLEIALGAKHREEEAKRPPMKIQ